MSYPLFHPARRGEMPTVMAVDAFHAEFPGEGEHVELKQGVGPSRIQETAVAFSNTDGGVMLLGVSPSHDLVGVTNPGERAKDVYQALRDVR
ncbi:MAG: ATP-binding protein, partial [Rhodococcus sp.]|nr:ATP-binding protein [Rhodococcus sp. (in: high G+C Gram-positive bacteria)]